MMRHRSGLLIGACLAACSVEQPTDTLRESEVQQGAELKRRLAENAQLSAAELRARHALSRASTPSHDAGKAEGLAKLQASTHALTEPELARLSELGFVVSAANEFPTMLHAYASFYVQDLPLYVTADSILDSLHRGYDALLQDIEAQALVDDLGSLLDGLRSALPAAESSDAVHDLDVYLAVAQGLMQDEDAMPVAGGDGAQITALTAFARSASAQERVTLFGAQRDVDFTQWKPRGHYRDDAQLSRYFQALSWLSHIDMRVIETSPEGERVFRRPQLEAAALLRSLITPELEPAYRRIDATLAAFAGERDSMDVDDLDHLRADLGLRSWNELDDVDSAVLARTILDKGYGAQRISAQLLTNHAADGRALPLSRAFALFGQRYTVDSYVLSNVVHDVVRDRLMPNPLDAAYAALGNDAALPLLGAELDQYASALESTRTLVDFSEPATWNASLYGTWLKALRALSPTATQEGLPEVAHTAAWDARVLGTQLASWAQLRHDTILYAKPSYTVSLLCEYPDAYVEPYPAFFDALHDYAVRGQRLATALAPRHDALARKIQGYFDNLGNAMDRLGHMARLELREEPFAAEDLAFINDAVRESDNCPGGAAFDGWYAKLDYQVMSNGRVSGIPEPVVTDIHTQPTDLSGRDVGRILHIGAGFPRLIVVTTQTRQGPRAYAGVVSSYRELITDHWQRLDDAAWFERLSDMSVPEPDWTRAYVAARSPSD